MIRTKIAYEDIKAGDLLEVVVVDNGLKTVLTGIAFEERDYMPKSAPHRKWWETSDGGMLAVDEEFGGGTIYRVDVSEVGFDDIQSGDLIEVSAVRGDVERIIRGRAVDLVRSDSSWWDGWYTAKGALLTRRKFEDKITILEREA